MELYLYQGTKLYEDKNFLVDNGSGSSAIESYLSTISGTNVKHFDNAQYLKDTGLDTEVKIALDQSYLEFSLNSNWNYCKIKNTEGWRYFYVRDIQWVSKGCLKLILHCDVLNTYQGKYDLDKRTTIVREHKDRFYKLNNLSDSYIIDSLKNDLQWDWYIDPALGGDSFDNEYQLPEEFLNRECTISYSFFPAAQSVVSVTRASITHGVLYFELHATGTIPDLCKLTFTITSDNSNVDYLTRNIDKENENINPILFRKQDKIDIKIKNHILENPNDSYYLIYKTNNAYTANDNDKFIYDNPINCFMCCDRELIIDAQAMISITPSDLTKGVGVGYFFTFPTGAEGKQLPNSYDDFTDPEPPMVVGFNCREGGATTVAEAKLERVNVRRNKQTAVILSLTSDNKIAVRKAELKRDNFRESDYEYVGKFSQVDIAQMSAITAYHTTKEDWDLGVNFYDMLVRNSDGSTPFEASSYQQVRVKPISEIDQSDTKLVKIIKLPYSPVFTYHGLFSYNGNEHLLKLNLKNNPYFERIIYTADLPFNEFKYYKKPNTPFASTDLRNDKLESKIYHSDFYQQKFIYDSYNYVVKAEMLEPDIKTTNTIPYTELRFNMITSTAASSNFLFDFNNLNYSKKDIDYNIMVVNRNLEMPIYNNYYLNYLKSGAAEAATRNKQNQQVASGIGTGVGIVQTIAGIALSATGYGATFGAPMIVSGVATTAGSLTSAISSSVSADMALQQKEEQLKNQAGTIQGCDDVGLLTYYSTDEHLNKMQYTIYELTDNTKDRILDLFYYCGYSVNKQGVPNTTSRTWFNFIQCEPVFSNVTFRMSTDLKNELINKYNQGVTVIHNVNNNYDFEQVKENYETFLLN